MTKEKKRAGETVSRVASFRCKDYDSSRVQQALTKALDEVGGIGRFVKRGDRVLLKPNLLISRPAQKLVTTDPEVVRAVVRLVKKAGGKPIIGDSPALGSAEKVAEKCGIGEVARAERAEVVNFNRPVEVDNPSGITFKKFIIDRAILESDVVINLPKLKTHGQMTLTLGVKNLFGSVPGARKTQWHLAAGIDRLQFARMLIDLYRRVSPSLTVMDGVVAMQGNGPQNGDAKKVGLLLVSEDAIALDSVVCEVVGLKKERMPTLLAADQMGVGQTDLKNITICGEHPHDSRVADFVFPGTIDVMNLFPGFLRNPLRDLLTARPVVNRKKCELCLVCVKSCPPQAIAVRDDAINFDLKRCIRCFCCQEMCPQGAITVGKGSVAKALRL